MVYCFPSPRGGGQGEGGDKMTSNSTARARELRHNQTDAERKFWSRVRDRRFFGLKFRRQVPVGPYIADFQCFDKRIIVELDGGQHASNSIRDLKRTEYLESQGFRVIRFWDNDVLRNIDGVLSELSVICELGS
jgi:very-short-patch-repair endonuclease